MSCLYLIRPTCEKLRLPCLVSPKISSTRLLPLKPSFRARFHSQNNTTRHRGAHSLVLSFFVIGGNLIYSSKSTFIFEQVTPFTLKPVSRLVTCTLALAIMQTAYRIILEYRTKVAWSTHSRGRNHPAPKLFALSLMLPLFRSRSVEDSISRGFLRLTT